VPHNGLEFIFTIGQVGEEFQDCEAEFLKSWVKSGVYDLLSQEFP
jgi:hypothetical protein